MATLVEKLRWMVGDTPPRTRIVDAGGIASGATTITLPPGDTDRLFPQAGAMIEANDDTDEQMLVVDTDPELEQIDVLRAQNGTNAAAHAQDVALFVDPSLTYVRASDAISDIIQGELWPYVWTPKELTISTFEADAHYSPAETDIEEITGVYQLVAGEKIGLEWEWTSPEVGDDANFPRGIIHIPYPVDTSPFHVAYKALVTLADATDKLLRLIGLGAAALLLEQEEMALTSPDQGKLMGVQEGSRARIAQQMWVRFERRRWLEKVNLEQDLPQFA